MSTHEPARPGEDAEEGATEAPAPSARPVNVGHLVMGVAFVGLVVVWALLSSDTVELADARWLLPLPWLVAGAVGLAAIVLRGTRREAPHHDAHHRSGTMHGWQ